MHNPIYFTWTILLDIQYSEHTTDNKNLQMNYFGSYMAALKRAVQNLEHFINILLNNNNCLNLGSYKLHSQNLFLDIVVALKRAV